MSKWYSYHWVWPHVPQMANVQLSQRLNSLCVRVQWLCPVVSDYYDGGCGTMLFFFELSLSLPQGWRNTHSQSINEPAFPDISTDIQHLINRLHSPEIVGHSLSYCCSHVSDSQSVIFQHVFYLNLCQLCHLLCLSPPRPLSFYYIFLLYYCPPCIILSMSMFTFYSLHSSITFPFYFYLFSNIIF